MAKQPHQETPETVVGNRLFLWIPHQRQGETTPFLFLVYLISLCWVLDSCSQVIIPMAGSATCRKKTDQFWALLICLVANQHRYGNAMLFSWVTYPSMVGSSPFISYPCWNMVTPHQPCCRQASGLACSKGAWQSPSRFQRVAASHTSSPLATAQVVIKLFSGAGFSPSTVCICSI